MPKTVLILHKIITSQFDIILAIQEVLPTGAIARARWEAATIKAVKTFDNTDLYRSDAKPAN